MGVQVNGPEPKSSLVKLNISGIGGVFIYFILTRVRSKDKSLKVLTKAWFVKKQFSVHPRTLIDVEHPQEHVILIVVEKLTEVGDENQMVAAISL